MPELEKTIFDFVFPNKIYACLHCNAEYAVSEFDKSTFGGRVCLNCNRQENKPIIGIKKDISESYTLFWDARRLDLFDAALGLPHSSRVLTDDEKEKEKRLTHSVAVRRFENGKSFQTVAFDLKLKRTFKALGGEIFTYHPEKGIYVPAKPAIEAFVQASLGDFSNRYANAEVLANLKIDAYVRDASLPEGLVPLKNGVFDFKEKKLLPHSSERFYTSTLPFEFNPSADCPNFKAYLSSALGDDAEGLKKQKAVRQFFAYAFVPGQPLQRAFLLWGGEGCGKSQVIRILTAFLGPENVSSVPLQKLEINNFAAARLYGKYLNACADIPKDEIDNAPVFKAIIGGDALDVERKFQDGFSFHPNAKLLFSVNDFPRTNENQGAWAARWVFIGFSKHFRGEAHEVKDIWKTCATPEELSGIFNLVLPDLDGLLGPGGRFEADDTVEKKIEFYEEQSEPETVFLEKFTRLLTPEELEAQGVVRALPNEELFGAFAAYLKERGQVVPPHNVLGRLFKRAASKVYGGKVKVSTTKTERVWWGLTLNEDWKLRDLMPKSQDSKDSKFQQNPNLSDFSVFPATLKEVG